MTKYIIALLAIIIIVAIVIYYYSAANKGMATIYYLNHFFHNVGPISNTMMAVGTTSKVDPSHVGKNVSIVIDSMNIGPPTSTIIKKGFSPFQGKITGIDKSGMIITIAPVLSELVTGSQKLILNVTGSMAVY